jgi:phosphoenolpyruvate phosphomutase
MGTLFDSGDAFADQDIVRRAGPHSSKAQRLLTELESSSLSFLMEAHSGLSAKIAEEAGFGGIWASGLSISTSLGVRDNNELSWTQVLETVELMADATSIPILLDGDTGYGNFNNFRRLVLKLRQRGVAGVCIEDKVFPKANSFVGEQQPLTDISEFCGKIRAGRDMVDSRELVIVARTETLISGFGMAEALKRAEAYRAAGADAILIHSKKRTADEIFTFAKEWARRCPLVIVPTTYYDTPTEDYERAGISLVIWANHNLRASINAMRATSRRIMADRALTGVEHEIAALKDVFHIAGNDELTEAEKKYLPTWSSDVPKNELAARGHFPKRQIRQRMTERAGLRSGWKRLKSGEDSQ